MKKQKGYRFTQGLFALYFLLLIWVILFKLQFDVTALVSARSLNLLPFCAPTMVNGGFDFGEAVYNFLAFLPLGLYLSMLGSEWPLGRIAAVCFGVSFSFELLQFVFAIGACDITDLLTNTCGGILGGGVGRLLSGILKERTTMLLNGVCCIVTVLVLALLLLLFLANG